jgi:hypothetical protein
MPCSVSDGPASTEDYFRELYAMLDFEHEFEDAIKRIVDDNKALANDDSD